MTLLYHTRLRSIVIVTLLLISANVFSQAPRAGNSTVPVMFDNVKIAFKNNGVLVEWANLTERELTSYVVERSSDARDYEALVTIIPRSNQNIPESYSELDAHPATGINYYRIRCNEISGRTIYSKIMKIETGESTRALLVYPNPVMNGQLSWSLSGVTPGTCSLQVVSASGVPVYRRSLNLTAKATTQTIDLPGALPAGIYRLLLNGEGGSWVTAFAAQ